MEQRPLSQLPWASPWGEFLREANAAGSEGACCVFVIDPSIPESARGGYSALVIAYARSGEPVTMLPDGGAALLIKEGGVSAGRVAVLRVLGQMLRLGLAQTLRTAVVQLDGDPEAAVAHALDMARSADAGGVAIDNPPPPAGVG